MHSFTVSSFFTTHAGVNRLENAGRWLQWAIRRLGVTHLLARWRTARAEAASDRRLWAVALSDARVMSELNAAISRETP